MQSSRAVIATLLVGYLAPLLLILIDARSDPAALTDWIFSLHSLAPTSVAVEGLLRHLSLWWFFYSIAICALSAIAIWLLVLADSSMSLTRRIVWVLSMLFFGIIAVPAYCVLRLWPQTGAASHA